MSMTDGVMYHGGHRVESIIQAHAETGGTGVSFRVFRLIAYTLALFAIGAAPAFAYRESVTTTDPAATESYACPDCHGLESDVTSPTVGGRTVPSEWTWESEAGKDLGSRKGPHGGYTTGTQKCQICHTMHGGSGQMGDGPLLSEETIAQTCATCHDGTGGSGVYGVIFQRTGFEPSEASATAHAGTAGGIHRIGWLNGNGFVDVPAGNQSTGGSIEATFTGVNGSLTCTDCHSAHNSNTVAPFLGDRLRSSEDTTSDLATNRLLRTRPTSANTTVTVYGSGWCASCHKGGHVAASPDWNHSVESSDTLRNYSKVTRLAGLNTSVTAGQGSLGGSNLGYLMPDTVAGAGGHGGEQPICQQCHEDSRVLGGDTSGNPDQFQVSTDQDFVAPLDGLTAGNPQFQNFPHESVNDGLLLETTDGLCLNCHWL